MGRLCAELLAIANPRRRLPPIATPRRRPFCDAVAIVLPGFLASDYSTATLRHGLADRGIDVSGWGLGINLGASEARLDRISDSVLRMSRARHRKVALVGWSLGGLMAREVAKRVPDAVDRVVTLGSPFSGDPRANHAWRLYEWINRHPVDQPPFACDIGAKPPVPTIALWSARDGIVAAECARGGEHERDQAIEVDCTHMGFTYDEAVIEAVVRALA